MNSILKILVMFFAAVISVSAQDAALSEESDFCITCHEGVTPGIYHDWQSSLHSIHSIKQALESGMINPDEDSEFWKNLQDSSIAVSCFECHGLNTDKHPDSFEHFDFTINSIVTPNDCKTCHNTEVIEYSGSKKANAYGNLKSNSLFSLLVKTVNGVDEYSPESGFTFHENTEHTNGETCYACHGTKVEVTGVKTIDSELGEVEVPVLSNWPNQGVGRINPDGSMGSCTSCHPRHSFSIKIARQPETCGQCHLEPDVPAYNVYKESKHGNIFYSKKDDFNWAPKPWKAGEDFTAPTCAVCHNAEIESGGTVIAERTHDFGQRLWVRIFGLPYSHPQSKDGTTFDIINKDGLPLPVSFDNVPASEFLISVEEQTKRENNFKKVCLPCHGTNWTDAQFEKIALSNNEADRMVSSATGILSQVWEEGIENNENPFDEQTEILWQRQWLFYANSVRYGTAMMGPDYTTFKNGWWNLNENLRKMHDLLKLKKAH